jgi:hypothetical protein
MDHVEEYLKKNNIPVTRPNYVNLNWAGDADPSKPLPAELEASLPKELQIEKEKGEQ